MKLLEGDSVQVAPQLLGAELIRNLNGQTLRAKIVEVEAYHQSDAASHSYRGQTPRNSVMFGPAGRLYVYFTYGMHFCMNIVTGAVDQGSAVLVRAVEPIEGQEVMAQNRGGKDGTELTNGPAKVCQALAIDKSLNGHDLSQEPLTLVLTPTVLARDKIVQTTRVGISVAKEMYWQWYIKGSPYVSKK